MAAVNHQRSTEEEEPPAKKAKIAALVRRGGSVSAVLVRLTVNFLQEPLGPHVGLRLSSAEGEALQRKDLLSNH